ncbi:hypothetical protein BDR22DRAFT_371431 [Usnea florida]
MVLPGYNVSEPIELAVKLYEIVESLRSAPENAKAFISKTNSFKNSLDQLDRILEGELPSQPGQDHLRATVRECRACIKRCEKHSEGFPKLTKDGKGKIDWAAQAARWTLQEKTVTKLSEEIKTLMSSISLVLAIMTYDRTNQGSFSAPSGLMAPPRSETSTSLPPYPSHQPNSTQTESVQYGKTPADLLPHVTKQERKRMDTDIPDFRMRSEVSMGKGMVASPQRSPTTLCPLTEQDEQFELDATGALRALERRRNTNNEVAISPTGLRTSRPVSEGSSAASQIFTSPAMSSGRSSMTEVTTITSRRDSVFAPESAVVEVAMEQLDGVQVSYYKGNEKTKYPVSKIESCRNRQTGRRYIIISPPASSKTKLYFAPLTQRVIAHSEHPQAYGGSTTKYKVKFIEQYPLRSQRLSSEKRPSDASTLPLPSLTSTPSATSVASTQILDSPILTANSSVPKEVSRYHEYDFEQIDDYKRFQELLMGPNVRLQLQEPVHLITAKKYEKRSSQECRLQYLRLWQSGGCQTLMFFANLTSKAYREYKVENFRPVDSRSKTTIRLDVHMPGMIRRKSSSKSPIIIPKPSAQEQVKFSYNTDEDDMTELDYLSIEFSSAEGRSAFLEEARFHSLPEESATSTFALHSRSAP